MRKGELERQTHRSLGMARNLSSAPMLGKWLGGGRAGGRQRLPGVWIGWDEAQCGVWPPAKSPC